MHRNTDPVSVPPPLTTGDHLFAQEHEPSVVVYKYGLLPPTDWNEECENELFKMTRLWNSLVEIEHDFSARYRAIRSGHLELVEAEADLTRINANIESTLKALKARRADARSKNVEATDVDERLQTLRTKRKAVYERVKSLRPVAREAMRPQLLALKEERKSRVKSARQSSGLYWGNYNAVLAAYDVARSRTIKQGGELRFRRHDGSGRLVAQIIGGITLEELFAGEHSQLRIVPLTQQFSCEQATRRRRAHDRTTSVAMVVYSRDRNPYRVTWPLVMHRPLPDDAIVKQATITRRRTGSRWRNKEWEWSLSMMCRVPTKNHGEPYPRAVCALDIGWRRLNDGLRVAVIASRTGDDTPQFEAIILPERLIEADEYVKDLQARIDRRVNEATARLGSIGLAGIPAGNPESLLAGASVTVRTTPKPTQRGLAVLARCWRQDAPAWQPEELDRLEKAVALNRRDWGELSALRTKTRRSRLDLYRTIAVRLAREHRVIAIKAVNWQKIYRDNDAIPAAANIYRRMAAVGELLSTIRAAAAKYGVVVHEHEGLSTWLCHACGLSIAPSDPGELIQCCPACGAVWDQDENAALNILAAIPTSASIPANDRQLLAAAKAPARQSINETRWRRARTHAAEKKA